MIEAYQLDDLLYLMERLRDPARGCPWDLKQTYTSLLPYTLEEAYEVADAIERADFVHLAEELGDLLFQVVYYSQLAHEEGRFGFHNVVDGITRKLIRRHPHVFPQGILHANAAQDALDERQVRQHWEVLKAEERAQKSQQPEQLSLLDDVPHALPALTRAAKLQKRAAQVGFDWREVAPVLDKIQEELTEVRQALANGSQVEQHEELGDLLFSVVNACRHMSADPETVLRVANKKFEHRVRFIEQQLTQAQQTWDQVDAKVLNQLWNRAKHQQVQ